MMVVFSSLNSRLFLSYVAVILVCLVLVSLGLLVFVQPVWALSATRQLEAAARATLPRLRQIDSPAQLHGLLAQAAEEQGARVLLLDETGTVRFDSDDGEWVAEALELVQHTPVGQAGFQGAFTAPDGGRWVFFGQPAPRSPGGTPQTVMFVAPREHLLAWFAENLLPPLAQAGLIALVLSMLLALLIRTWIAAPLHRVAEAAEAIAHGATGARAPIAGPSEVQALAHSFNTMAGRVEAAHQSQRDLVANVSHELKTPLTSIQGFSQALLDGTAQTPEAAARAARVIHEQSEHMCRMVESLLVLARFDAGQMTMERQAVGLVPLLRTCVDKLMPQAESAQVTLELDVPDRLTVVGDADRLAQVLANLLDNGIAHTHAGGRVTVAARQEKGQVEVAITDSGEGIPAEELPRIFERFYQVDRSRRHNRGVGLGLAITREIVEAHGGTVVAESVVGLGSKFTVRLPACTDEETGPIKKQEEA